MSKLAKTITALWYLLVDLVGHLRNEAHRSHSASYRAIRVAYVTSKGQSRRCLRALFRLVRPARIASTPELAKVLPALREDGITVMRGFLPAEAAGDIRGYLTEEEGYAVGHGFERTAAKLGSTASGLKLQYPSQTILRAPHVGSIIESSLLQELAGAYLGCVPIFAGLHAWWSLPDPEASEEDLNWSAQQFHFDYDWPAFVKFFIYLTDVDEESGPFTFVIGTHERKREWRDGRLDEAYVQATYGDRVKEIMGSAGDMIIADTAGYHKGKRVTKGRRLILQMEFAVSRLGASCQYDLLPRQCRPRGLFPRTFDVFGG